MVGLLSFPLLAFLLYFLRFFTFQLPWVFSSYARALTALSGLFHAMFGRTSPQSRQNMTRNDKNDNDKK